MGKRITVKLTSGVQIFITIPGAEAQQECKFTFKFLANPGTLIYTIELLPTTHHPLLHPHYLRAAVAITEN
jgi:hypothetical protein